MYAKAAQKERSRGGQSVFTDSCSRLQFDRVRYYYIYPSSQPLHPNRPLASTLLSSAQHIHSRLNSTKLNTTRLDIATLPSVNPIYTQCLTVLTNPLPPLNAPEQNTSSLSLPSHAHYPLFHKQLASTT